MSSLQKRLNKIIKSKLKEHNCPNHWVKLGEWEKSEGAQNLSTSRIKTYLNLPIINNFGNLEEEASKLLVSRYHNGKFGWTSQLQSLENL